jgi:hypothetical protein
MNDTTVLLNDTLKITATGSDTNGAIKKYFWAFDNGTFKDSTDSGYIPKSFSDTGQHTVRVGARDDDGIYSVNPDTVIITVRYKKPVVVAMNDTAVAINDSFAVHAAAHDTDGTIQKYYWAFDGINYKDSTTAGQLKTIFKLPETPGAKTMKVKVRDDDGVWSDPAQFIVTVHLYQPTVIPMNDTSIGIYDSLYLHAVGSDTNGTVEKYVWALDGQNYKDTVLTGRFRANFTSAGAKTVKVKVIDDDGIPSAPAGFTVTVTFKRPVITGMNDTSVIVNLPFNIHATAHDTDGYIARYIWALDGITYRDTTAVNFIPHFFTTTGPKLVKVVARDDDGFLSDEARIIITVNPKPGGGKGESSVERDPVLHNPFFRGTR